MSGKAKPQKHTAKEIAMKAHEAKMKKEEEEVEKTDLKKEMHRKKEREIFLSSALSALPCNLRLNLWEFTMKANTLKKTGKLSKRTMKQSSVHRLSPQLLKNK